MHSLCRVVCSCSMHSMHSVQLGSGTSTTSMDHWRGETLAGGATYLMAGATSHQQWDLEVCKTSGDSIKYKGNIFNGSLLVSRNETPSIWNLQYFEGLKNRGYISNGSLLVTFNFQISQMSGKSMKIQENIFNVSLLVTSKETPSIWKFAKCLAVQWNVFFFIKVCIQPQTIEGPAKNEME